MAKQLVEPFRVEAYDNFPINNHRWRRPALVGVYKFLHCCWITAHVPYFVLNSLAVKIFFQRMTRWTCRLSKDDDLLRRAQAFLPAEDFTSLACIFDFIGNLCGLVQHRRD